MQRYILRRLAQALVSLVAVSVIIFVMSRAIGDPTILLLPPDSRAQDYDNLRRAFGLDQPGYIQYLNFVRDALSGDMGTSFRWKVPALPLVIERLGATFQLAAAAFLFAVVVGLAIGTLSALNRGSLFDSAGKAVALLGQAAPTFWVGLMLMLLFAVQLRLLPTSGRGGVTYFILPTITLGWYSVAAITRLCRSSMLDVLDSEFIKMARIKGVPERLVVWKHALKNASIPVVTLMSLQFAALLRGSVITETIFSWPGVGKLVIDAIAVRDFPVIQAAALVASGIYIATNLIVDILYVFLDPRIRYE